MSHWHWVRHGPTHQKTFVGWRDVPADLSDTAALARLHAALPADALIVSSDLDRSVKTADAIAGERQRLPHDPHLREFHFGVWDGLAFDVIAAHDPDQSRAYWENPGAIAPPGGESWDMAAARVGTAVARLDRLAAGRDVIVVAHIGVILTQVQAVLGLSPSEAISHKIDNLSVTTLDPAAGAALRINHLY